MNLKELTKFRDYLNDQIGQCVETTPEKKPFPKIGDDYYYIACDGDFFINEYEGDETDLRRINVKNFFKTKLEAEMSHQRDLIFRHDGGARNGDSFYFWSFYFKSIDSSANFQLFYRDPKFKTKRECEDFWTDERKAVIQYFLDKN